MMHGETPACIAKCGLSWDGIFYANFKGDGANRQLGVNQMEVRTLQYAVVNLDYNSVVGLNDVGTTH
jgi:hypothetical protein